MASRSRRAVKWFEREFGFDQPVSLFPNVVERLRGTPLRLEERLSGVERELLVARPADGSWSIQENAGHLLDLEPLWLGRVEDFLERRSELREADLSNRRTHEARHNDRPISEIVLDFRRARGELVELLDSLSERDASRVARHPRLRKPMRLIDHAFFVAEHDDHHLARITHLLRPR
jgi:uncharacterized damage-inducible protein DinB